MLYAAMLSFAIGIQLPDDDHQIVANPAVLVDLLNKVPLLAAEGEEASAATGAVHRIGRLLANTAQDKLELPKNKDEAVANFDHLVTRLMVHEYVRFDSDDMAMKIGQIVGRFSVESRIDKRTCVKMEYILSSMPANRRRDLFIVAAADRLGAEKILYDIAVAHPDDLVSSEAIRSLASTSVSTRAALEQTRKLILGGDTAEHSKPKEDDAIGGSPKRATLEPALAAAKRNLEAMSASYKEFLDNQQGSKKAPAWPDRNLPNVEPHAKDGTTSEPLITDKAGDRKKK